MLQALDQFFMKVGAVIVGGIVSIVSIVSPAPVNVYPERVIQIESPVFGTSIPTPVANFTTALASSIGSSDTTMTLVSTSTKDGTSLVTGQLYGFTIEEGTSNEEHVIGTASSSQQIVNMTRGVSVITGNTSITALKKAHRRGASVKITDAPVLLVISRIVNGDETIPNLLTYSTSSATSTIGNNILNLANVGYVNSVASSGAPDATDSVEGIVQFATIAQTAAGTATSSGASFGLIAQNKYFNATSTATTTVVVTQSNGLISPTFIATSSNYVWSGNNSYTGTSTFSGSLTNNASTTFTATTTFSGTFISKFGGTGADGALSISSGSSTIDLGNAAVVEKNYSSISITGTGWLNLINPATNGTTLVLKSRGACDITSTSSTLVILAGMGATGGAGGTNTGTQGADGGGGGASAITDGSNGVDASGGSSWSAGSNGTDAMGIGRNEGGRGAGQASIYAAGGDVIGMGGRSYGFANAPSSTVAFAKFLPLIPGSGGGGGGGNASQGTGGAGGRGAGALYLECAGSLNFTGTILATGAAGGSGAGGGGGGGGGVVIIAYTTASSTAGTITVTGGAAGSGTNANGGAGGNGYSAIFKNNEFD